MARGRKTVAQKQEEAAKKETNSLLDAVKFCAGGFNENGETYSTHAMIWGGYISTYNGIVMYGHKVDTTLQACPHYGLLLKALKATDGAAVQITQLDLRRIQIKQKGFRTVVPCLDDYGLVTRTAPDTPISVLDSRIREGFETMKQIVNKRGDTVMQSSVLVGNGFMVACDNVMLGHYWHGLGFPEVAVPADFVDAVLKVAKPLVSFGYTPGQSLTFYFDDGSFIRTQLYAEQYPDWTKAMPEHFEGLQQLPDDFFTALDKIEPFLGKDQSHVYMSENLFHTQADPDQGTAVDCPGLLDAPSALDVDRLLKLKGIITHIDTVHREKCRFVGENFRGVLMTHLLSDKLDPEDGSDPEPAPHGYVEQNGMADATFAPPLPAGPVELDDTPADGFGPEDEAETPVNGGGFSTWQGGQ